MSAADGDGLRKLSDGTGRAMKLTLRVWQPGSKEIRSQGKRAWTLFTATGIDHNGDSVGLSKSLFGTPQERTKLSKEITTKYAAGSVWRFAQMTDVVAANPKYTSYTRP